jgi:hypothetical protein
MGIMNVIVPFFGGFPMCHGGGRLVGQYFFGVRTGGANIMEELVEIDLGLFFASSDVVENCKIEFTAKFSKLSRISEIRFLAKFQIPLNYFY